MELPTIRQLEYAVAVADHAHFGRAAESVNVSQPGLSGQIRELERRLGVEIFERSRRAVSLTAAGADVVERGRRILRDVDELTLTAVAHRGTLHGQLRVAAIPTVAPYLLPALVQTTRGRWPDVDLDLQELQTVPMVAAIENGEVDIGLLAVPFDTGTLHIEPMSDEPFHLALPEGHELVGTEPLDPEVLTAHQVLLLPDGHCLHDHALRVCELAGRVDHSEIHGASLATLTQMVAAGVGVTLLPQGAIPIEARPGSGITTRPFRPPAPGRTIALGWRKSDPRAGIYRGMVDVLSARIAAVISAS